MYLPLRAVTQVIQWVDVHTFNIMNCSGWYVCVIFYEKTMLRCQSYPQTVSGEYFQARACSKLCVHTKRCPTTTQNKSVYCCHRGVPRRNQFYKLPVKAHTLWGIHKVVHTKRRLEVVVWSVKAHCLREKFKPSVLTPGHLGNCCVGWTSMLSSEFGKKLQNLSDVAPQLQCQEE